MNTRRLAGNLVWVDLENPTREEVLQIADEFGINQFVAEELLSPSPKPRLEMHTNYFYTILHFPALRHTHKTHEQEVDFIVGKNFFITAHYDAIDALHKFSKIFEMGSLMHSKEIGNHAGYIFYYLVRRLYRAVDHELDYVKNDLMQIEEHIFSGHESGMVRSISRSARDLLNLRQTIEPHRDILKILPQHATAFFGDSFAPYMQALENDYYRLHNHIMRQTESLHELRETNNSLLSTKENATMRILTTMALLTFPLALIVSVLSYDSPHNPLRATPYDFWLLVGLVGVLGVSMFGYFEWKGWLK